MEYINANDFRHLFKNKVSFTIFMEILKSNKKIAVLLKNGEIVCGLVNNDIIDTYMREELVRNIDKVITKLKNLGNP